MDQHELDSQRDAYEASFKFHDENELMLERYVDLIVASLRESAPRTMISLGIGQKVVCSRLIREVAPTLDHYVIVEGSQAAIGELRSEVELPPSVDPVHAYFEDYEPDEAVDAVEMGFVLEHVEDPSVVVERYARFLKPGGRAYIAVPNATSLHRVIGHEVGLLDSVYRLSAEDHALGHRRYYDVATLLEQIAAAGLVAERVEGIYLKPLTTSQMRSLGLSADVMRAFMRAGVRYPALSNAVYVEAVA
jgi:SAM-dependent methyltransferase